MKVKILTIFALLSLLLAIGCSRSKKEVETIPEPEAPEPVAESESIAEPVTPVVTPEEEPEDINAFDPSHIKLEDVYFDFDKSDLRPDTIETLDRHVRVLLANPNVNTLIEGHCDERGTEEYNMALGERRAERVRVYLESRGVESSRLRTISYGELRPKAPGHNEEAWSMNRRAHFVLSAAQ